MRPTRSTNSVRSAAATKPLLLLSGTSSQWCAAVSYTHLGKTSIATDAILNQKNTGVLCIYVAIGQKASSIARVAGALQKHGAMSLSLIHI